ncbi:hypothetical protein ABT330_32310 [Streptomyces sp. NPDC000658]|uniref:hypothetical protein n=1 Tax=Streptomyces sp. NPDC000658 TaxID=3154266 RepID=UPI003320D916
MLMDPADAVATGVLLAALVAVSLPPVAAAFVGFVPAAEPGASSLPLHPVRSNAPAMQAPSTAAPTTIGRRRFGLRRFFFDVTFMLRPPVAEFLVCLDGSPQRTTFGRRQLHVRVGSSRITACATDIGVCRMSPSCLVLASFRLLTLA